MLSKSLKNLKHYPQMTLEEALKVLDDMAAGIHPDTGEPLPLSDVSNSRSAIRALQIAIEFIKNHSKNSKSTTRTTKSSHKSDTSNSSDIPEEEQGEITTNPNDQEVKCNETMI